MAAEYEKTQEIVEQFRELSPVWLSRFPYNSGSALENKKRELKEVMETALKQKADLQEAISQLEELFLLMRGMLFYNRVSKRDLFFGFQICTLDRQCILV